MTSLPSDSYTAHRLEHATSEHLHLTTRRTFIGPIPEGWLNSHRKQWYRQYVKNRSQRAPTFTAAHHVSRAPGARAGGDGTAPIEATPRPSSQSADTRAQAAATATPTSTTSLLHSQRASNVPSTSSAEPQATQNRISLDVPRLDDAPKRTRTTDHLRLDKVASNNVSPKIRFSEATKLQLRNRAQRLAARGSIRSSKIKPGELLKMEKMLVRIDATQQTIKEELDEKTSQGIEARPVDKWREYIVACRKHEQGAILQLYSTRVIATTAEQTKKKPKFEVIINRATANVNMFSSLDKTLCLWSAEKNKTQIYYLRPQSGASSVDWWTFLRGVLGYGRARTLQVNVPDLSVTLRLDDPFKTLDSSKILEDAAGGDDEALMRAVTDEKRAAGAIVTRCIEMLQQSPQWGDVIKGWAERDRIGLAWKRYDRLEWIHGEVEQRMYGTIAMSKTHELELRPKDHYPLRAKNDEGAFLEEPAPIEGFLIRLTSQRGHTRSMGKMMFKRLYFTSQNQYLIFTRPARASPPPPPKLAVKRNGSVPTTQQLLDQVPLTYDIEPYALDKDGHIAWLDDEGVKSSDDQLTHDKEAEGEANRNINMLLTCDGFINMCHVKRVRKFQRGATPADDSVEDGPDVDFDADPRDHGGEDGRTTELDEDRTFELVMGNGLIVRLQAYNQAAKNEWMKRMRQLVAYWKARTVDDMNLFKSVRQQNLETLQIDERTEAQVGSFAYKWEVGQSYASPILYNMCGIASCRSIHMAGVLFRKPRRHTTFTRCHVILSAGHLLIFQDTLRESSGRKLVHSHLERLGSVDLKGCYLYSGMLTENDLLYQNQTFDANMPGHHALPRIYLEDAWTSTDEDAMTTFVIWHANSKSWFRSSELADDVRTAERSNSINDHGEVDMSTKGRTKTKLTRVSQLGVKGRSVVFKARSRAERDHWVLAIQIEIERMAAQNDEVRLVDADSK